MLLSKTLKTGLVKFAIVIFVHYFVALCSCNFFLLVGIYNSTKKRQHHFDILKPFFVRQSSVYKTSDSDRKVNRNIYPDARDRMRLKPRPNALDFSLYIARQMSSIVECCREGVAKRSRLFTRLGTQHSTDVLFDE